MKVDIRLLKRKEDEALARAQALLDKGIAENRDLSPEEREQYKAARAEADRLHQQAEDAQEIERQRAGIPADQPAPTARPGEPVPDPGIGMSDKELARYSLVRAILAAANHDWRGAGLEREASEAVAKKFHREPRSFFVPYDFLAAERRDLIKGTAAQGGYTVATDLLAQSFIELLRNKMVVQAAGAFVLSGLVGDVAIPRQSGGATAYWVGEGVAPTESQQAFQQVPLAPKTVGAFTDISRKLLLQSSIDVEAFVRNDLATVLALEMDRVALHGSGAGSEPLGIAGQSGVAVVAIGANGGAPTWAHVVSLETEVAQDNADIGALAYVTNAKVRGKLKQVEKAATTGQFIWVEGATPLNGYRALVSNQVRSDLTKGTGTLLSAAFFGNWRDLIVGQWGTLDMLVDPFTGGAAGAVRVIAFQDIDIAVRHPESFSVILDAITT